MKLTVSQRDQSAGCKGRPRAPRAPRAPGVYVHGVPWWAPVPRSELWRSPQKTSCNFPERDFRLVGQSCSSLKKRKSDFLRGWLTKCHLFSDLGPAALPLRPKVKWGKSPVSRATRVYQQRLPREGSLRCGNTFHGGPERRRTSLFQRDFHKLEWSQVTP